jgi:hypothetical protein
MIFYGLFIQNEEFGLNDINTRDFESGVDESYHTDVVLSDRLTHVLPKSADHPIPFAAGMTDSTPGGRVFPIAIERSDASTASTMLAAVDEGEEDEAEDNAKYFYSGPAGWAFEKVKVDGSTVPIVPSSQDDLASSEQADEPPEDMPTTEVVLKRQFNDDSALGYLPYEEFSGTKPGMVFRLGSKGLGYYEDKSAAKLQVPVVSVAADAMADTDADTAGEGSIIASDVDR